MPQPPNYLTGFGNHHATEAVKNSLPIGRNSPQQAPHGLYAEQLSGSAFTALPHHNLRSWLYRILPSVKHSKFEQIDQRTVRTGPDQEAAVTPNQLRWDAPPYPQSDINFVEGWITICTNGDANSQSGNGVHLYVANKSMTNEAFFNSDGELLIVPQEGALRITTEMGILEVEPKAIAVIPRGVRFKVELPDGKARGYICENYGSPLRLPYRGPIGANGLANERDFEIPVAAFEESSELYEVTTKYCGRMFKSQRHGSPFDVVAWHGNYAPYRYDLRRFNTVNTVSYDHPDPSIFTVLTSPTTRDGLANIDFVIFPPRWMVAENTFRPPWYHRNIMSEYMGLIEGEYDAKPKGSGFVPGGGSLHNCMSAHGPDAEAFAMASTAELKPTRYDNTMAFMFETNTPYQPTAFAMNGKLLQDDYLACWETLQSNFKNP